VLVLIIANFIGRLATGTFDPLAGCRVNTPAGFLKFTAFFQKHFNGDAAYREANKQYRNQDQLQHNVLFFNPGQLTKLRMFCLENT
jgi:hypothetical protein